jgi:hypothetical protein
MLAREQFVDICKNIIVDARKNITITNQKSGYLKYHKEIKYYNYIINILREVYKSHMSVSREEAMNEYLCIQHKAVKMAKIATCGDLSIYFLVELIKKFNAMSVDAKISIVNSKKMDHSYLRINILLDNEKEESRWEIDAWDPRIIDVTKRPDGSIKNAEILKYGKEPNIRYTASAKEFKLLREDKIRLNFRLPSPDSEDEPHPRPSKTPEREVLDKYRACGLHKDYSIRKAINDALIPQERLRYAQKRSLWQCKHKEKENDSSYINSSRKVKKSRSGS